jgi:hypothetical protein
VSVLANAFGESPASTSAYVDALIAELGSRDPLDVLTLTPSALRGATAGLSDDEERARAGVHSERGEESAERLVRLMAGHDLVHLRQIARVRAALGV